MSKIPLTKKAKVSTLMFIILSLFFIVNYFGYIYLVKNIKIKHKKNEQILFYKLQIESNNLLLLLLSNYSKQKEEIRKTHLIVKNYLDNKDYDINLEEIHKIINKDRKNNPYNIYITDENLKIINTTFKKDLGFDLSFAEDTFKEHRKNNMIGVSAPIFETYTTNFFSYSDSYLPNTNRIMQISYTYPNTQKQLKKIQDIIDSNDLIKNSKAYVIFKDGYIGDFVFKSFKAKKVDINSIKERLEKGKDLSNKLQNESILIEEHKQDGILYKDFYFSQDSVLFNDAQIIFNVSFDQNHLRDEIHKINLLSTFLSIILLLTIYFLLRIRDKENLLNQKDTFIKYSVHEIKTPLSIISLNNQLRQTKLGTDKYSDKINSAIKTLKNSYEDMSYLISKDHIEYEKQLINLNHFLKDRVNFFSAIAIAQGRELILSSDDKCQVLISEVELTRLIDNNLSNAIKYSDINSKITVNLKNNSLSFKSFGKEIVDTKTIFEKYQRENSSQGGHGLGLSIVKDIANKNNIRIKVSSTNKINNFTYLFDCHCADISKVYNK
ncbi:MAG: sensor histidine kinase [Poseidonibacter sp.]|uniref:sensor histidine kinase n=1 Tax=Poseidonibacter sp. TaxID=2321188 RepID=UPI00359DE94C